MSDRVLEEIAALKDEDWALREEAAVLLGEFADPRAVMPLIEALHDEDRAVRDASTAALRKIGLPAVPGLIGALRDPNGNVQEAAVAILKDQADPRTLEPLIQCLASKNWVLRMHAAQGLSVLGDQRAVQSLLPLLMDQVKAVRVDTAEALARIGKPALAPLLEALRHDEWILRLHACEALGKMGVEEAVEPLSLMMLHDRDAAVRQDAAKALGGIRSPKSFEALVRALPDLDVRPFAVEALGKLGLLEAAPVLIDIATGKSRPANSRIVPSCGDESGQLYLEEMEVQEKAIGALAEIGDPRAIVPLVAALQDTRLRGAAANALSQFGLAIVEPMLSAMKNETDSNILYHARAILTAVGWRPKVNAKIGT
jgi:HEAT repeat protein